MKLLTGVVVSTKMAKTATILVERFKVHPIYKKRIKISKIYHVHDEIGVRQGDRVKFVESRPISKTKKWKIIGIIKDDTAKKYSQAN